MKSVEHNGKGEYVKETSPQVKSAIFRSSAVAMFDSDDSLRSPRREFVGENEKASTIKARRRNISSRSVEEQFSSNTEFSPQVRKGILIRNKTNFYNGSTIDDINDPKYFVSSKENVNLPQNSASLPDRYNFRQCTDKTSSQVQNSIYTHFSSRSPGSNRTSFDSGLKPKVQTVKRATTEPFKRDTKLEYGINSLKSSKSTPIQQKTSGKNIGLNAPAPSLSQNITFNKYIECMECNDASDFEGTVASRRFKSATPDQIVAASSQQNNYLLRKQYEADYKKDIMKNFTRRIQRDSVINSEDDCFIKSSRHSVSPDNFSNEHSSNTRDMFLPLKGLSGPGDQDTYPQPIQSGRFSTGIKSESGQLSTGRETYIQSPSGRMSTERESLGLNQSGQISRASNDEGSLSGRNSVRPPSRGRFSLERSSNFDDDTNESSFPLSPAVEHLPAWSMDSQISNLKHVRSVSPTKFQNISPLSSNVPRNCQKIPSSPIPSIIFQTSQSQQILPPNMQMECSSFELPSRQNSWRELNQQSDCQFPQLSSFLPEQVSMLEPTAERIPISEELQRLNSISWHELILNREPPHEPVVSRLEYDQILQFQHIPLAARISQIDEMPPGLPLQKPAPSSQANVPLFSRIAPNPTTSQNSLVPPANTSVRPSVPEPLCGPERDQLHFNSNTMMSSIPKCLQLPATEIPQFLQVQGLPCVEYMRKLLLFPDEHEIDIRGSKESCKEKENFEEADLREKIRGKKESYKEMENFEGADLKEKIWGSKESCKEKEDFEEADLREKIRGRKESYKEMENFEEADLKEKIQGTKESCKEKENFEEADLREKIRGRKESYKEKENFEEADLKEKLKSDVPKMGTYGSKRLKKIRGSKECCKEKENFEEADLREKIRGMKESYKEKENFEEADLKEIRGSKESCKEKENFEEADLREKESYSNFEETVFKEKILLGSMESYSHLEEIVLKEKILRMAHLLSCCKKVILRNKEERRFLLAELDALKMFQEKVTTANDAVMQEFQDKFREARENWELQTNQIQSLENDKANLEKIKFERDQEVEAARLKLESMESDRDRIANICKKLEEELAKETKRYENEIQSRMIRAKQNFDQLLSHAEKLEAELKSVKEVLAQKDVELGRTRLKEEEEMEQLKRNNRSKEMEIELLKEQLKRNNGSKEIEIELLKEQLKRSNRSKEMEINLLKSQLQDAKENLVKVAAHYEGSTNNRNAEVERLRSELEEERLKHQEELRLEKQRLIEYQTNVRLQLDLTEQKMAERCQKIESDFEQSVTALKVKRSGILAQSGGSVKAVSSSESSSALTAHRIIPSSRVTAIASDRRSDPFVDITPAIGTKKPSNRFSSYRNEPDRKASEMSRSLSNGDSLFKEALHKSNMVDHNIARWQAGHREARYLLRNSSL